MATSAAVLLGCLWLWRLDSSDRAPLVHLEGGLDSAPAVVSGQGRPAERVVTEVPGPDSSLALEIRWEDGEPLHGVSVVLSSDENVVGHGTTDGQGAVRFEAVDGDAFVHIVQGSMQLQASPLLLRTGHVEIRVPLRAQVDGVVRIDGSLPIEPLQLMLRSAPGADAPSLPPRFIRDALGWRMAEPTFAIAQSDPEGGFRFAGLPLGWRGDLAFPGDYRLMSGDKSLALDQPAVGLLVELERGPAITGRVLSPAGAPLARVRVVYALACASAATEGETLSGADGRFRAPLMSCGPVQDAELYMTSSGIGTARVEVSVDSEHGTDVGDVLLAPARDVRFIVKENHGEPIAGAIVAIEDARSGPSDSAGACVLRDVPLELLRARADALAHRTRSLEVPPDARAPLEILRGRSPPREVLFRFADGTPAPAVRLVLTAPSPFEDGSGTLDATQIELGASRIAHRTTQRQAGNVTSVVLRLDGGPSGRVLITGLRAGERIELEAQDASGTAIGWRETIVLEPEEARRIEATLATEVSWVSGSILGETGAPILGAKIYFVGSDALPLDCDETGRFESEPLHVAFVDLLAIAPGHAARLLAQHPVAEPADIVLGAGSSFVVSVQDDGGGLWPAEQVRARLGGRTVESGKRLPDGRQGLDHLPEPFARSGLELEAIVGGCTLHLLFPSSGEEAVLRIPVPGSIRAAWERDLPPHAGAVVRLESSGQRSCLVWHPLSVEERTAHAVTFPLVLPGRYVVELVVDEDGNGDGQPRARTVVDVSSGLQRDVVLTSLDR